MTLNPGPPIAMMRLARVVPAFLRACLAPLLACAMLGAGGVAAQTVDVVEYYNAGNGHYFITSLGSEIEALDSGRLTGWARTGGVFKAYSAPAAANSPVCRFYIPPAQGDSHFYSASPDECAQAAAAFPAFVLESSNVMYIGLPDAATGACAAGQVPVYRLWNNRADSNHRYTTDVGVRNQMVARGWIAEGYGPDAVIMCAPPAGTGQLLVRAWKPDGSVASIADFVDLAAYRNGDATMYQNYGVFPIGRSPGTPQVGSDLKPLNMGGIDYIAFDVPASQPLYFTALWRAPVIGTVYMRADNGGNGFATGVGQRQHIEIPYHFALSEFDQAKRMLPAEPLPADTQALLAQATAAIDAAKAAASPQARALAAYDALSFAMPLKERLVLEASNRAIAAGGRRADFDLNYEGFGSWTESRNLPGYEVAKDAGFKSVYTVVDWKIVSPSAGTYDFAYLDYQIDRALELGFKVALQVNWTPGSLAPWVRGLGFEELKSLYYENARRVVSRYGSKVSVYYACGEMELNTEGYTLEQAVELARQSLNGARAAAPGTPFGIYTSASAYVAYQINPVASPTYFSGLTLLERLTASGVAFDFVGLQMQYGTVFAPIDLQRFQEVLQDTHRIVKVPIYMGETGYSSKSEDYGIAAPNFWHGGFTQQAQYEWADGTLRALYAMPFVKGYYWVHLDPDDYDPGDSFISMLIGTGLVRSDGAVKKVRSAFKDFTTWVDALPPQ